MFIGTLQDYTICPRACHQYFVYRRNFNWPHRCVFMVHFIIVWERRDRDLGLCGVSSLVMYSKDAPQRIVSDKLPVLLYPFLYSMVSPVEPTEGGGGERKEAKSYDGENAWSSIVQ